MPASVDILHPERPNRVAIVASNPAVSADDLISLGFINSPALGT
jgi:hypothetical protein